MIDKKEHITFPFSKMKDNDVYLKPQIELLRKKQL